MSVVVFPNGDAIRASRLVRICRTADTVTICYDEKNESISYEEMFLTEEEATTFLNGAIAAWQAAMREEYGEH